MRRKDPAIGAHHSATWSVMFLLTTDASNAGTKEDTMRPFLVVIPELSSNSLLDIHKVVRDLPAYRFLDFSPDMTVADYERLRELGRNHLRG